MMTKDGLIFEANSLKQGRLQALTRQQLQGKPPKIVSGVGCRRPVAVGQFVSLADLGAQARNRDEVKIHGKDGELMQILDLTVLAAVGFGGHSCEGEQTQAWQRGDDAPVLDEPR